jgi:nucleoside-diphosphate-sugar epimerase
MVPLYQHGPVVVTGGSGFIGTHLISALLEKEIAVINLDTKPPTLPEHSPYWTNMDLMNPAAVSACITEIKPALVYNLAAHASLSGGAEAMRVNVEGLRHLVDACASLERSPLIVHASTQLAAGAATGDFDPLSYQPYGPYGESKVLSEQLIRALPPTQKWTIIRPSNIWGPYHPSFANQIWRFIRLRLYLHPAGFDVLRSYGYIGNVVHQLLRIAEVDQDLVERKTFYVGDAPVPSTVWLDGFSIALTGKPVRRVPGWFLRIAAYGGELLGKLGGPSPINLGRLERMTSDFPVPIESTFSILGEGPVSLEQGIERTVAWLNTKSEDKNARREA